MNTTMTNTAKVLPKAAMHCEDCSEEWFAVYPHAIAPGVWHIPASRGAYYLVTRVDDGTWRCSCAAASFGNLCYHITGMGGVLDMEARLEAGALTAIHLKYIPGAAKETPAPEPRRWRAESQIQVGMETPVRRERVKEEW